MSNYSFQNLVIKGGGIRGIAYLGAFDVLNQKNILGNIKRVAGASAGAIQSLMVAMHGNNYDKLVATANTLDFSKVPGIPSFFGDRTKEKKGAFATLAEVKFLKKTLGLHNSNYIESWFKKVIGDRTGDSEITFKDFVKVEGCLDLHVAITNVSSSLSVICCSQSTPDMKVYEAVLTSMSIPIFFEAITFNNATLAGYFGDGGVMNNYPIQLFDDGLHENPNTLGLFLYAEKGVEKFPEDYKLKTYAGDVVESLLVAQDWATGRHPADVQRSIQIFDEGIKSTSFDVTVGDANYNKLVQSGKQSTINYFELYDAGKMAELQVPKFASNPAQTFHIS